jgi:hypothetical protein
MNFGRKIAEGTPDQIPGCRFVEQKQTRSRGESARSPDQSLLAKDRLPIALSARYPDQGWRLVGLSARDFKPTSVPAEMGSCGQHPQLAVVFGPKQKSTRMTQSGLCLCLPRIARQVSLEHLQHIIPDWVPRSAGPSSR